MHRFFVSLSVVGFVTTLIAGDVMGHEPNRECQCVKQRVDVIGPIGADWKPSYRRVCNRPRYLHGKLAYWVAPSSQEAIAWHKAMHKGAYDKNLGRIEPHYFYKKPWEALQRGPRVALSPDKTQLKPLASVESAELLPQPKSDEMSFGDEDEAASSPSDLAPEVLPPAPVTKYQEAVEPKSKGTKSLKDAINRAIDQPVGSGLNSDSTR